MRTFIVAVTSSDGFIANESHVCSWKWNSAADKEAFKSLTKAPCALIVGAKTFETFAKPGEQPKPLKGRLNIVYSRSKKYEGKDLETTQKEPARLINDLILRGFGRIAIIGGAEIYRMFIEAGEVEGIYLTIEAEKFGHGIPFYEGRLEDKFKLVNEHEVTTDTGKKTKFLTYKKKA